MDSAEKTVGNDLLQDVQKKLPDGVKLAIAMDKMNLDMSKTQSDGSYKISGDMMQFAQAFDLGVVDTEGNVQVENMRKLLNLDDDIYADAKLQDSIVNYASSVVYMQDFMYDENGKRVKSKDGKRGSDFYVELDAKTMLQFQQYQELEGMAEKGTLTQDAVKEFQENIDFLGSMTEEEAKSLYGLDESCQADAEAFWDIADVSVEQEPIQMEPVEAVSNGNAQNHTDRGAQAEERFGHVIQSVFQKAADGFGLGE